MALNLNELCYEDAKNRPPGKTPEAFLLLELKMGFEFTPSALPWSGSGL
ncbi:hypothetical protein DCCM_3641 [Desulfocucumis palustris]|uniref:Uncharacterized protein n=1 Tax=Desulfocucumis palustris TaxID=1898651 RepID=A0A2L2XFP1_9FIRM|nr:hypothetical protein DCCM_3641 [Desulfocucumis palustris]